MKNIKFNVVCFDDISTAYDFISNKVVNDKELYDFEKKFIENFTYVAFYANRIIKENNLLNSK